MTHSERETIRREIKDKKYLYEALGTVYGGSTIVIGYVNADTDDEAKVYALKCFSFAKYIRRDHWGYGPAIRIDI